jgi:hypothetical protein
MKRTSFVVALMTVAGFMAADTSAPAQAGSASSPTAAAGSKAKARIVTVRYRPRETRVSSDSGLVAVGAGFQAIDGTSTLPCPATAVDCIIIAEQNVQVRSATAGNNWAICTQVDGAFMPNPLCPFLGPPPVNTFTANSFAQSSAALAPGVHTVQTFIFSNNGIDRSIYELTYTLYFR